jgi:hypothetical protein
LHDVLNPYGRCEMKVRSILLVILPLSILVPAQDQQWVKTYNIQTEEPTSVRVTSDGGMIIAASVSNSSSHTQICALNTDSSGSVLWAKGYDWPLSSKATGCTQLKSGNFLLWGDRTPKYDGSHSNNTDALILELASNGEIAIQKTYGVEKWNYEYTFNHVDELEGGGHIACGKIEHLNKSTDWYNDESKGWIVRLDGTGAIIFQKAIALRTSNTYKYLDIADIRKTPDGGYVSVGWYYSGGTWTVVDLGILIIKMNAKGDILWQKSYDGGYYGTTRTSSGKFLIEARRIIPTSDGGYMLVGSDWTDSCPWCAKLDAKGKVKWARQFTSKSSDDDVELRDATLSKDGGCMLAGVIYPKSGSRLGWFAKVRSTGGVKVVRSYVLSGAYYNHFLGVSELASGGFALVGRSYDNYYSRELWLMTTYPDGLTCSAVGPNKYKPVQKAFKLYEKSSLFVISKGTAAVTSGEFVASTLSAPEKSWCGNLIVTGANTQCGGLAYESMQGMLHDQQSHVLDRQAAAAISCLRVFLRNGRR